jgi:hypothetical protein
MLQELARDFGERLLPLHATAVAGGRIADAPPYHVGIARKLQIADGNSIAQDDDVVEADTGNIGHRLWMLDVYVRIENVAHREARHRMNLAGWPQPRAFHSDRAVREALQHDCRHLRTRRILGRDKQDAQRSFDHTTGLVSDRL